MTSLAGKVAVVTGTSPNIGGGIAEGLADEGAVVACVDLASENALQCAEAIRRRGGQALGIACDITDEGQVQAMVARVRDTQTGELVAPGVAGELEVQSPWRFLGYFRNAEATAKAMGIEEVVTAPQSPWQKGQDSYCTSLAA